MNEHVESLNQIKATVVDLAIKFGPKVFVAIAIMVGGYFAGRWVGKVMARGLRKLDLEPPVRDLLVRIIRILVLGMFAIMALQNLGVELLPLIAGIGVAGAGIALAMQGVLSNVVAGLTIIFTRPFRVSEYISIVGVEGKVENITLFSTTLTHADLSRVVVPNRKIVGEILHNYGKIRQLNIMVGVAYDTDLNKALATISEILQSNPRVLKDPAPGFGISVLADSSIHISVNPWVNVPDFGPAGSEINKALVETFRGKSISIPFPQQEVRMLGNAA
ncbi:MAG: mechanosensitive ion channel family protein [Betaproteobacteria bacterium]|nr:mechanosensitive ion channel family protein [Betaproteobacteria bacterium]